MQIMVDNGMSMQRSKLWARPWHPSGGTTLGFDTCTGRPKPHIVAKVQRRRGTIPLRRLAPIPNPYQIMSFRAFREGCLAVAVYLAAPIVPAAAQASSPEQDTLRTDLISPGDVIKLNVWREPEWSGEFAVSDAGVAVFPRLGAVPVTTMTADSLRRFLVDSLGRFLRNPSIEVIPLRRVQVLGAVRAPGLYPVPPTVTIGDVIALAGGATPDGKTDQAVLRREGEELRIKLRGSTRLSDLPIRTGDQIFVPQRSWVSRNTGLVAAGLSATTSLVIALLLSR